MINFDENSLSTEDRLLSARIRDYVETAEDKNYSKFSFFLDERQCCLAENVLLKMKYDYYSFSGGYENAKRKVLGVFPEFCDDTSFPISTIEFLYRKQDILTHRDFLGAIMALNVKRETVGDIIVGDGKTYVFVYDTVKEILLNDIRKIGSVGVKTAITENADIESEEQFEIIEGIVASQRLDCIVSLLTKLSREKSSNLIKSIGIDVNYVSVSSISFVLNENDVFSIRGYGKYIFESIGTKTKKDKIHVRIKKYI